MKNFSNKTKIIFLSTCLLTSVTSCTKNFEKDNVNKNAITEITPAQYPQVFNRALSSIVPNGSFYETVQRDISGFYSQYFAHASNPDRYNLSTNYMDRMYRITYKHVGQSVKNILDTADPQSAEYALANIIWVYSFSKLTDLVGPIPYSKALVESDILTVEYDKMEDIYADFFVRLTSSANVLKNKDASTIVFNAKDNLYAGDINKWMKFANSLKLRLAMRISKVDPVKAKQMAEEAIAGGTMTVNEDNALLTRSLLGNDTNGLAVPSAWNASTMSATMDSYLSGYDDPRISKYFQKRSPFTKYTSRRNGIPQSETTSKNAITNISNAATDQSPLGMYWATFNGSTLVANSVAKQHVMCAAESYFLRAEAALNGWNAVGTAKELYEEGIRKSLNQWGVTDATIINNYIESTNEPTEPNDYYKSPKVSTTPIKWASTSSLQRKQIGTQKWIAIFPDSYEAWAEFRRTGYPDFYDLKHSDDPDLPQGTFIKRWPYHTTEYTNNLEGVQTGLQHLGGPDKASTKLWWDVD